VLGKINPHLFIGLALDGDKQIGVFRLLTPPREGHMSGPGIVGMVSTVDEEHVHIVRAGLQQQRDRRPHRRVNIDRSGVMLREPVTDVQNAAVHSGC